jgi:preprotein translocase subunit SecE
MGVETGSREKRMAKAIAASADDSFGSRVKSWPERVKVFYNDVRTEMKKVTAPGLKEVQATTAVVIITVFLFGLYFWIIDNVIGRGIDSLFRYFTHR